MQWRQYFVYSCFPSSFNIAMKFLLCSSCLLSSDINVVESLLSFLRFPAICSMELLLGLFVFRF